MSQGRWAMKVNRCRSEYDLSAVEERKTTMEKIGSAIDLAIRRKSLSPEQNHLLPPKSKRAEVRRASVAGSRLAENLRNDIKKFWARRSSLNIFRSSKPATNELNQEGTDTYCSEESSDCLSDDPPFLIVDRSLLLKNNKRRFSLNVFSKNN